MSYHQFTSEERFCLWELLEKGHSIRAISRAMGRSPSTISRELKRNRSKKGNYRNVFLTDEDVQALKAEIGSYAHYVDRLSNYMASTGKVYQNHAATIRRWAERDAASTRIYECKEGESL